MKNYIKCKLCLAMAEYQLKDMDLCTFHYIRLSNDIYSKDGHDMIPELMRLLD